MKKLLLGAAFAFGVLAVNAQNKIGYINAQEVMASMPELEKANKTLQAYQTDQAAIYQELTVELNALDSAFVADSSKLNESRKEFKRNEINKKVTELQKFEQEAKERIQAKQEEVVGPIRDRALKTINDVAKENGYGYVFNEDALLVKPQGDNLINLVKAKLGVKPPAPKPAAAATRPAVRK